MTKLFFDTEFTGLHQKTTLISIGIVSVDGKSFYAEFSDYDEAQLNDWLRENVIGNLRITKGLSPYHTSGDLDKMFVYGNRELIKEELEHWLKQFDEIQMWSDCLAYDWVLFNNIWGHAFSIPKNIYYIPFDICPLLLQKTGDADISREDYAGKMTVDGEKQNGFPEPTKHNALWDAWVIRACYTRLMTE